MTITDRINELTDSELQQLLDLLSEVTSESVKPVRVTEPSPLQSERKLLVAYYMTSAQGVVDESTECAVIDGVSDEELKRHCESLLPVHMRPSQYVAVNRFPKLPNGKIAYAELETCLLYTSPSPRDRQKSRMPSSA